VTASRYQKCAGCKRTVHLKPEVRAAAAWKHLTCGTTNYKAASAPKMSTGGKIVVGVILAAIAGGIIHAVDPSAGSTPTSTDPITTTCENNWLVQKDNIPQTHSDYMKSCESSERYLQQFLHDHATP
jgi:hypothetical protein